MRGGATGYFSFLASRRPRLERQNSGEMTEAGHTLGWRHEHTRPESGTCFEDNNWRPLTDYDRFSVMHYPQCNGGADWSLKLTHMDKNGAACVYGAAPGFNVDPQICPARG